MQHAAKEFIYCLRSNIIMLMIKTQDIFQQNSPDITAGGK
jgi:hypothetical protein